MSLKRNRSKPHSNLYGKKAAYCREKDLPRLTGLWPGEINSKDLKSRERIVTILRHALRLERQRGKSGHWCYDINRHLALKHALAHEITALKIIRESCNARRNTLIGEMAFNHSAPRIPANTGAPPETSSHPVLFLALPTASSS